MKQVALTSKRFKKKKKKQTQTWKGEGQRTELVLKGSMSRKLQGKKIKKQTKMAKDTVIMFRNVRAKPKTAYETPIL